MWMSLSVEVAIVVKYLKRLGPNGKLFAFDQDKDALLNTIDDDRFHIDK